MKPSTTSRWPLNVVFIISGDSRASGRTGPHDACLESQLFDIVAGTPWLMLALHHVRDLRLDDWCIGAGAIRGAVWDQLVAGQPSPHPSGDIDVAYFDVRDISRARDQRLARRLSALPGGYKWDVVNQAGVHEWYVDDLGNGRSALPSLEAAIGTWPEYATCVGVRLLDDGSLRAIAPYGLADLFSLVVRHNPSLVGVESYRRRVAGKRFEERWPGVTVIGG